MLHDISHPVVIDSLQELHEAISEALKDQDKISFKIDDGNLFYEGEYLAQESVIYYPLVELLESLGINELTFNKGLTLSEIQALLSSLIGLEPKIDERIDQALPELEHVTSESGLAGSAKLGTAGTQCKDESFTDFYDKACELTMQLFIRAKENRLVNIRKAKQIARSICDRARFNEPTFLLATVSEPERSSLWHHSLHVGFLAGALGERLNLSNEQNTSLCLAALMHDIGLTRLPGDLSDFLAHEVSQETGILASHTFAGASVLSGLDGNDRVATVVAFEHHMGHDQSINPTGISKRPHIFSRLVQVADVYESMVRNQNDTSGGSPYQAMGLILSMAGSHLDPLVVSLFAQTLGVIPVGTFIVVDTGDIGIVLSSSTPGERRSQILVVCNASGVRLDQPRLLSDVDIGMLLEEGAELIDPKKAGLGLRDFWQ